MQHDGKGLDRLPPPGPHAPKNVTARLSLYLRELDHLAREGKETISSRQLGRLLGFTDAQVRKDLAHFGQFGHPGVGYRTPELIQAIRGILGTDRPWNAVMIGAGNLGRALLGYHGFSARGFRITAVLDADPRKVGTPIEGLTIRPLEDLSSVMTEGRVRLGVVTVPAHAAQGVADLLVQAGVQGILNFAPTTLVLPKTVSLVSVDLTVEWEQLSFSVISRGRPRHGRPQPSATADESPTDPAPRNPADDAAASAYPVV